MSLTQEGRTRALHTLIGDIRASLLGYTDHDKNQLAAHIDKMAFQNCNGDEETYYNQLAKIWQKAKRKAQEKQQQQQQSAAGGLPNQAAAHSSVPGLAGQASVPQQQVRSGMQMPQGQYGRPVAASAAWQQSIAAQQAQQRMAGVRLPPRGHAQAEAAPAGPSYAPNQDQLRTSILSTQGQAYAVPQSVQAPAQPGYEYGAQAGPAAMNYAPQHQQQQQQHTSRGPPGYGQQAAYQHKAMTTANPMSAACTMSGRQGYPANTLGARPQGSQNAAHIGYGQQQPDALLQQRALPQRGYHQQANQQGPQFAAQQNAYSSHPQASQAAWAQNFAPQTVQQHAQGHSNSAPTQQNTPSIQQYQGQAFQQGQRPQTLGAGRPEANAYQQQPRQVPAQPHLAAEQPASQQPAHAADYLETSKSFQDMLHAYLAYQPEKKQGGPSQVPHVPGQPAESANQLSQAAVARPLTNVTQDRQVRPHTAGHLHGQQVASYAPPPGQVQAQQPIGWPQSRPQAWPGANQATPQGYQQAPQNQGQPSSYMELLNKPGGPAGNVAPPQLRPEEVATTERYWALLEDIKVNLVPVLEPVLQRLNLTDVNNPQIAKLNSIKMHILPRLKISRDNAHYAARVWTEKNVEQLLHLQKQLKGYAAKCMEYERKVQDARKAAAQAQQLGPQGVRPPMAQQQPAQGVIHSAYEQVPPTPTVSKVEEMAIAKVEAAVEKGQPSQEQPTNEDARKNSFFAAASAFATSLPASSPTPGSPSEKQHSFQIPELPAALCKEKKRRAAEPLQEEVAKSQKLETPQYRHPQCETELQKICHEVSGSLKNAASLQVVGLPASADGTFTLQLSPADSAVSSQSAGPMNSWNSASFEVSAGTLSDVKAILLEGAHSSNSYHQVQAVQHSFEDSLVSLDRPPTLQEAAGLWNAALDHARVPSAAVL